ncbi:MAG: FtsQ-type POTRA domain-containing protein [Propionibacteriaceae bacterium]|nr:FtsQ-type POTRA domain-containing protein [Propionibacteriaceae bacterium]
MAKRALFWHKIGFGLVCFATLGAVVGAVVVVFFTPVLEINEIKLTGNHLLSDAAVKETAQVDLGTPQVLVDTADVALRLAGLPAVEQVQVSHDWPNTLAITLAERTAVVSVPYFSGFLFADAAGVVFDGGTKNRSELLQVSADPSNSALLRDCYAVSVALSASTAKKLDYVSAQSSDAINLHFRDGILVIWGNANQSELKSEVLDALLKQKARVYNVSAPASPTLR